MLFPMLGSTSISSCMVVTDESHSALYGCIRQSGAGPKFKNVLKLSKKYEHRFLENGRFYKK